MEKRSIKRNAILNLVYTVVNILTPLITYPYISRVLLSSGLGKVNFFTSVSGYGVMFASLGVSTYGIREVAKRRENKRELSKFSAELFMVNTISTIIVCSLFALSFIFVDKFKSEMILFWMNFFLVIISPLNIDWLYSGLEKYDYITKRMILFKLLYIILTFVLVREKSDYNMYALINLITTFGTYLTNIYNARKYVQIDFSVKLDWKRHLRPLLILFGSVIAVSIYTSLDTIMLGFICNDSEVGLYAMASKIKWLLLAAINALSAVLLPRLASIIAENKMQEYKVLLSKSVMLVFSVTIPLVLFFILEADDCIMILGGHGFAGSIVCMQVLMPILIISGFSNILGNQILIAQGQDSKFTIAVTCGAIADLFFNIALMPKFGCVGAAIATLFAEFVQMNIQFYFTYNVIKDCIDIREILKYVLSSIFLFLFFYYIKELYFLKSFIRIVLYFSIYFLLYYFLLVCLKERCLVTIIKHELCNLEKRYKLK